MCSALEKVTSKAETRVSSLLLSMTAALPYPVGGAPLVPVSHDDELSKIPASKSVPMRSVAGCVVAPVPNAALGGVSVGRVALLQRCTMLPVADQSLDLGLVNQTTLSSGHSING